MSDGNAFYFASYNKDGSFKVRSAKIYYMALKNG